MRRALPSKPPPLGQPLTESYSERELGTPSALSRGRDSNQPAIDVMLSFLELLGHPLGYSLKVSSLDMLLIRAR